MPTQPQPALVIPSDEHLCANCKLVPHNCGFPSGLCLECWFAACEYNYERIIREFRQQGKGG
jgi:hypothetical protein